MRWPTLPYLSSAPLIMLVIILNVSQLFVTLRTIQNFTDLQNLLYSSSIIFSLWTFGTVLKV